MSGIGGDALPNVSKWSGSPRGCPGVIGRPARMTMCDREVLPEVRKWSGGPPRYTGVVGRTSRKSGSGQETISDVRE